MTFSPEVPRNLQNGIAQIGTESTGSGFTNNSVEQRYGRVDVTRKFGGLLDWYADPATQLRFQNTPQGAVAQPSFFYAQPINNIPGGFTASSYPGINLTNGALLFEPIYQPPLLCRRAVDFLRRPTDPRVRRAAPSPPGRAAPYSHWDQG